MEKSVAVITGVSKGIGRSTALLLLKNNYFVIGWGRTNTIENQEDYYFIKTDIQSEKEVGEAYNRTIEKCGKVDVLINNAGLGFEGNFEEISSEKWHQMFDTNVNGLFYCTKAVIPGMKERESGYIINISSIAGNTGIKRMAGYCATKFAVKGISQSLYKEVRDYGIKVSCIYPGSTKTNFFDAIDSVELNDQMMRPEDIAETILHCLESHPNYHHVDIEVRPLRPKR